MSRKDPNHKAKRKAHNKEIRKQSEIARRAAQSKEATASRRKVKQTPTTMINDFFHDVVDLAHKKDLLRKSAQGRINLIKDLKTADATRYAPLDPKPFEDILELLKPLDEQIGKLGRVAGEAEDATDTGSKLEVILTNTGIFQEALTGFQEVCQRLLQCEAKNDKDIGRQVTPLTSLDDPEQKENNLDFELEDGKEQLVTKDENGNIQLTEAGRAVVEEGRVAKSVEQLNTMVEKVKSGETKVNTENLPSHEELSELDIDQPAQVEDIVPATNETSAS